MSATITPFGGITKLPLTPEKILDGAKTNVPEELLVVGWDHDGKLYVAGTHSDTANNLLILRMAIIYLEKNVYAECDPDGP